MAAAHRITRRGWKNDIVQVSVCWAGRKAVRLRGRPRFRKPSMTPRVFFYRTSQRPTTRSVARPDAGFVATVVPVEGRIDRLFSELRAGGGKALMPFVCAGYPRPGDTARVLPALQEAGALIVEVGIPFSDPIADGPVIAAAMHEALQAGATPAAVFAEVASVRDQLRIGLVAMCSVSIVFKLGGPSGFVRRARDAGFDGLIIPDAPVEESTELAQLARDAGLTLSLLIAPTTPQDRAQQIAAASTGFVYLLARSGITGETSDAPRIAPRVASIRAATSLPIACGFGISTPQHVRAVVHEGGADAAIVGSALVRRMGTPGSSHPVAEAARLVEELSVGLDPAP